MFCVKLLLLVVVITLAAAQHESESKNVETFIVKGHNAKLGQFPFYVYLEVSMSGGGGVCGASLISWLVTAGHRAFNVFSMAAHLGALKAKDTNERGRKIYFISAKDIHVHPRYSKPAIRK